MANVLIAGCGYVGSALAARLVADGHSVWALRRQWLDVVPGVRPIRADLTRARTPTEWPAGLDFVFYTAAADGRDDASYASAYVTGLGHVLQWLEARRQQPRRVFFTSSTAVFAQSDGEWVTEDSPTRPERFTGLRLLEAERLLDRSRFPATVVRLAGIYGPGRTRLIDAVCRGQTTYPASPPIFSNRIHRDDAAGSLRHLMQQPDCEPLYLGVDSDPAPIQEVVRWIAGRLGVDVPASGAATFPLRRGGSKRCCNARLLATGYKLAYPGYRDGYSAMLGRHPLTGARDSR